MTQASTTPATNANAPSDTARVAGRGGMAVLGAKAFFILSGLAQTTILPRVIGLAGFGALSRVLAVANVVNNVMITSGTQGVSRLVARAPEHQPEALRMGLRVHVVIAIAAAALFAIAAPVVAWFEGAMYIAAPLAAMAGVVACYGVYAAFVGALNGTSRFGRQAALDVTFAVLRTTGLLGLGWLFVSRGGSGVLGATIGFVLAAAAILVLALRWTGVGRTATAPLADVPTARAYIIALVPLAIAQLFTNAVMQSDITLLGRFLSASAHVQSADAAFAAKSADEWVAVYRLCQLFAFLPYQLLFSVTQVLFPMVARAHGAGDTEAVRAYVARGARIGALACGLMIAVIAAMPGSLLRFAFSPEVADRGAATLRVLALGQGAFAMLGLATTVLVSLGRERDAAGITLVALVCVVAGCFGFVPGRDFGEPQLFAAACATSAALVVGVVIGAARVVSLARAFIPVATGARVLLALGIAVAIGTRVPRVAGHVILVVPLEAIAFAVVYLVVLVATRELKGEDVQLARSLLHRKRAA